MTRKALLLLSLAALAACAVVHSRQPEPQPGEGAWAKVRDERTRHFDLYDGFLHRATVTATHLDAAAREARARRLAVWSSWTDEELQARLASESAEAAKGEEFVVVLYTADKVNNDLDGITSVWRVEIVDGDTEIRASKITSLDADATVKALYPWVGTFDVVYDVRFPRAGAPLAGRPFVLLMAGAVGKIPLDFGAMPKSFTVPRIGP